EETIFVELEADSNPVAVKKSPPAIRRDLQHFTFGDDNAPSTPAPKSSRGQVPIREREFSIEQTPDPHEAEYRARALQKKEMNHFRPDTLPHFDFTDVSPDTPIKKENTEAMN